MRWRLLPMCLMLQKPECYLHETELTMSAVGSDPRLRTRLPITPLMSVTPISTLRPNLTL